MGKINDTDTDSCKRVEMLSQSRSLRRSCFPAQRLMMLAFQIILMLSVTSNVYGFSTEPNCKRKQERPGTTGQSSRLLRTTANDEALGDCYGSPRTRTRRNLLISTAATLTTSALALELLWLPLEPAFAEQQRSAATATATTTATLISPEKAVVTDKVFFNVRISRQDGTFYVRDDLPDTPENQVFSGRLVVGLFGKNAPNHVQRFLQYVNAGFNPLDDDPLPSYSRSTFSQFDQATGVLYGGNIPSLEVTELQGSAALRYGGRLFPAKLWVDGPPKISHAATGLLTHKQFDVMPAFGITTRSDTTELDRTQTVFGKLIMDEPAVAFLKRVTELPVYSVDRPVAAAAAASASLSSSEPNAVDEALVEAVFNAQRDFFRGAAKSLGDTRVSKLYEGKLLRRVEVTQVGVL